MSAINYITAGQLKFPNVDTNVTTPRRLKTDIDSGGQTVLFAFPPLTPLSERKLSDLLPDPSSAPADLKTIGDYHRAVFSSTTVPNTASYPQEDVRALMTLIDHLQPSQAEIAQQTLSNPALENAMISSVNKAHVAIDLGLKELGLTVLPIDDLKTDMPRFLKSIGTQLGRSIP